MTTVNISVRPLVEYVFRSGSIDSGFHTAASMHEGTRIHQRVQRAYQEGDQKEVYLQMEIPFGRIVYHIEGRCDGLIQTEEGWMIDEIKSTSAGLDMLEGGHAVHWAQAEVYAYMAAKDQELEKIGVQLTYVDSGTGEERRFKRTRTMAELAEFVIDVIRQYALYAELRQENARLRDESIRALPFPFAAYREGQRKLAGAVYGAAKEKKKLFAKAPTGIGKTISTLFPSVKAIGEGLLGQIFYLTAKTITRTAAEQALTLMENKGLRLQSVTITAKDKACLQEEVFCSKDVCPYADGYYDRINGAVFDILSHETIMTRQVLEQYARKHRVCPFEFSLDTAYAADAIICDYNYIYDPRVSLKRLPEEQKKRTVLLVDEAHNLVDRGREMFSAVMNKANFLQLKRDFKTANPAVAAAADAVNKYFIELRKACGDTRQQLSKEAPAELVELLEVFVGEAERELAAGGEERQLLLDTYFASQNFIRMAKLYDSRYITYAEVLRNDVSIRMFCLDPSYLLSQADKGFRSVVFFSATLAPLSYYRDMLGADSEDYSISIPSPFRREQLDVRIHPLSTRYRDRERTAEQLADLLHQMISGKQGNYMFFFPSYQYLQSVYEIFTGKYPEVQTIVQGTGMGEEERERFLAAFRVDNQETLAGFAVLGGIFSEGIDLQGDRLIGVAVVGVGLPQLGLERNLIRDYFNGEGKNGYDYSYVLPGMNKVLQAGGRLIRSEEDEGVLLLIDDRFKQPHYRNLLPEEWKAAHIK
ncbi:helicase C-terminal domain-containing protein [Paenibacillus sp.]|jgi:Rad3-related DNA helicase|uniref:helicase C-terminal domain-containing protein n=1 Tax=Paenibacillus sp. TaxID=58172 RepID=UPI0028396B53|nr:helicase C-terminal domain-containing protein [Paenibacillus sp.]MDR0267081.1 PD-(D/E)XK nuclease family protein [Paenibacillus sp.]